MRQIEVSYDESKERIAQELRKHSRLYLATSEANTVTVRFMGFVSEGIRIWLVTDESSRKCKQIKANPNVGIAIGDDLQIEGVASLKGHPMAEENSHYISLLQELHPEMYDRMSRPGRMLQREGSRVIEVNPRRISLNVWTPNWDLEADFKPHALILNVPDGKAYEIYGTEGDQSNMYRNPAYWE